MIREVISTSRAPRTGLPYAQAVRYGSLVFVSGQVAFDPQTGSPVGKDIRSQTRQVLANIEAILEEAGTSLAHGVDALCFLRNASDFEAFNEVYGTYFSEDGPPRTTVQAAMPRDDLLVEVRLIAGLPDGEHQSARS